MANRFYQYSINRIPKKNDTFKSINPKIITEDVKYFIPLTCKCLLGSKILSFVQSLSWDEDSFIAPVSDYNEGLKLIQELLPVLEASDKFSEVTPEVVKYAIRFFNQQKNKFVLSEIADISGMAARDDSAKSVNKEIIKESKLYAKMCKLYKGLLKSGKHDRLIDHILRYGVHETGLDHLGLSEEIIDINADRKQKEWDKKYKDQQKQNKTQAASFDKIVGLSKVPKNFIIGYIENYTKFKNPVDLDEVMLNLFMYYNKGIYTERLEYYKDNMFWEHPSVGFSFRKQTERNTINRLKVNIVKYMGRLFLGKHVTNLKPKDFNPDFTYSSVFYSEVKGVKLRGSEAVDIRLGRPIIKPRLYGNKNLTRLHIEEIPLKDGGHFNKADVLVIE